MPAIAPITFKPEETKKVFCPVLMKESGCELFFGKYCGKNLPERMECARLLDTPSIYGLIPHGHFYIISLNTAIK
jgi:hypothetical protein